MAYIGQQPVAGDSTSSFRLLDNIASYTLTFDGSSADVVSVDNDTLTVSNHRFVTAQRITYNDGGGTAIGGLSNGVYYIIKVDQNTIKLATSASDANNNSAIDLTSLGAGTTHTINVAFDGVNTKFKATYNNGTKAKLSRAGQLLLSINGVIQQPQETSAPTVGFGIDADSTIVFSTAPAGSDVVFGNIIANTLVSFDVADNDVDNFTGDGSTLTFNLSKSPTNNQNVLVTLDGVVQYPSDGTTTRAYSIVGSELTFASAPDNGVEIQARHIGFAGATTSAVTGFYGRTGNVVLTTADDVNVQNITGVAATFTGNVSIAGTLTYEDVTNIDSVGLITARSGIIVSSGSTSAPSIAPIGDTDTGIFFPSADTIAFTEGGAEAARIDSSGRLLVGTSSYTTVGNGATLQVKGDGAAASSMSLIRTAAGGPEFHFAAGSSGTNIGNNNGLGFLKFLGYHTNGYDEYARIQAYVDGTNGDGDAPGRLVFSTTASGATSPTERMRIDSDGRLLVGTTAGDGNSTAHFQGNAGASIGGAFISLQRGQTNPTSGTELATIAFTDNARSQGARIQAFTDGDWAASDFPTRLLFLTTADGASTPTERMRIDSQGRMGLGTASPDQILTIRQDNGGGEGASIRLHNSSATVGSNNKLIFTSSTNATAQSAAIIATRTASGTFITFESDGTNERLRIDESGRLLVGTSSDISGTSNTSVQIVGSADNLSGELYLCRNDSTTASSNPIGTIEFRSNHGGTYESHARIQVQAEGGVGAGDKPGRIMFFTTPDGSATPTERMRISANGNTLIGTTSSPYTLTSDEFRLTVGDATEHAVLQLYSASGKWGAVGFNDNSVNGSTPGWIGYYHPLNYMTFTVNSSERMRIDSSGRLLVGTSSSAGAGCNVQIREDNFGRHLELLRSYDSTETPARLWFSASRGSAASPTIQQSGDAVGEIRFNSYDGTDYNSQVAAISARVDGTPGSNDTPGRLVFSTTADGSSSPTERMRISSYGVSRFTTDGSYAGTDADAHAIRTNITGTWLIDTFHAGASANGIHVEYGTTPNGSSNYFFYADDATAKRFAVRANGGIENYQSNNVNLSDEREKKNIETLDSTWGCLKNWDLKKFHYNEDADTDDKRYGVIAQQVAPHCPEVITDWVKQRAKDAVLDDDGNVVTPAVEEVIRMGVKEQQMMWMAIKALQEAQTRIETLEAEVAALKGA